MYFRQIIYIFLASYFFSTVCADEEKIESDSKHQITDDQAIILLDAKIQQRAGIKTSTLQSVEQHIELSAYGKAINPQPLFELQNRYLNALSEQNRANILFNQSQKNKNRQENLYQYGASSKYKFLEQQSQTQIDKALLDTSQLKIKAVVQETKLKWGDRISSWIFSDKRSELTPFLTGQQTLIQIILPSNDQMADTTKTIFVGPTSNRKNAEKAEFISTAPSTDYALPGLVYFFKTQGKNIKPGMNLNAWIPQTNTKAGTIIPESALIWTLEQSVIYLKLNENSFIRYPLTNYSIVSGGYFTTDIFKPNQEIVINGTGIILSEELRGQLNEDE